MEDRRTGRHIMVYTKFRIYKRKYPNMGHKEKAEFLARYLWGTEDITDSQFTMLQEIAEMVG